MWVVIRPVQAVTDDIFIRTVRPRHSANCFQLRRIEIFLLTYLVLYYISLVIKCYNNNNHHNNDQYRFSKTTHKVNEQQTWCANRRRRFWHATSLRSAIRRHHPPQRAVSSQICCFLQYKTINAQCTYLLFVMFYFVNLLPTFVWQTALAIRLFFSVRYAFHVVSFLLI